MQAEALSHTDFSTLAGCNICPKLYTDPYTVFIHAAIRVGTGNEVYRKSSTCAVQMHKCRIADRAIMQRVRTTAPRIILPTAYDQSYPIGRTYSGIVGYVNERQWVDEYIFGDRIQTPGAIADNKRHGMIT